MIWYSTSTEIWCFLYRISDLMSICMCKHKLAWQVSRDTIIRDVHTMLSLLKYLFCTVYIHSIFSVFVYFLKWPFECLHLHWFHFCNETAAASAIAAFFSCRDWTCIDSYITPFRHINQCDWCNADDFDQN